MDDGLKVGFGNNNRADYRDNKHSSIKMTSISRSAVNPKRKLKLGRVALIGIAIGLGGLTASSMIHNYQYEAVLHDKSGDYTDPFDPFKIIHNHDLTQEDFIRDYKYLNPNATEEEVINALTNGEYVYYVENNGEIKVDHSADKNLMTPEVYESVCKDFANDVIENNPDLNITRAEENVTK